MEKKRKIMERLPSHAKETLLSRFEPFLAKGKFVNVATCSSERMPNVAPKLVVKTEGNILYLIDYVMGRTYSNLKENPRVSIAFMEEQTLTGHQFNGTVAIIEHGEEFDALAEEFHKFKIDLSVERIMVNVRSGKKTSPVELALPEKFAILKIKVIEIVEITSSGMLRSHVAI